MSSRAAVHQEEYQGSTIQIYERQEGQQEWWEKFGRPHLSYLWVVTSPDEAPLTWHGIGRERENTIKIARRFIDMNLFFRNGGSFSNIPLP